MVIELCPWDPSKADLPDPNFDTYLTLPPGPLAEGLQRSKFDSYLSNVEWNSTRSGPY